jgi:hypothetical protein
VLKKHGRKHERINLFRAAGITFFGHRRHIYQTQNISLTGMFITGQFEHPLGTSCSITLAESWSGQVFVMNFNGKVVRHDQEGIAIQFTEMALKPYALLQTVLIYGSSNPLLLGQEFAKGYPFEISEISTKNCMSFLRPTSLRRIA